MSDVIKAVSIDALPRITAPGRDKREVMGAAIGAMFRAFFRRLIGRKMHEKWGFGLELMISATRASWSRMPTMGMVRWRNVGEAMAPLRMDGLTPRFLNLSPEAETPLYAAWVEPPDAAQSVLLYFHGGGFVFGSLRTHGELIGGLARAARAKTLAIEYRLAPEHPSPAAVTDTVNAYRYLLAEGHKPENIALAGDSAGGTLVLSTLLALRDQGIPLPAAGVAISPWVDLACSGESFDENARYDFVGKEHCQLAAKHYLDGKDSKSLSPLFASLTGLPPLLIQAGSLETLVDQIRVFAKAGKDAGNDLTFSEYPAMVHVWHLLKAVTPDAKKAIDEAGAFIRERTG